MSSQQYLRVDVKCQVNSISGLMLNVKSAVFGVHVKCQVSSISGFMLLNVKSAVFQSSCKMSSQQYFRVHIKCQVGSISGFMLNVKSAVFRIYVTVQSRRYNVDRV